MHALMELANDSDEFVGQPNLLMIFHHPSLLTVSNTLGRSRWWRRLLSSTQAKTYPAVEKQEIPR